jgi:CheY-like chemotaxis protein
MFMQVHPVHVRSQGGLGIGLTLVKRLVEMHGGRVSAFSDGEGHGAEFVVCLPVAPTGLQPEPSSIEDEANRAPVARRVLVVDDNSDSGSSLAMMLELMGHQTAQAYDGQEAVEAAAQFKPDVVVLDIGMPGLNGYEAARRVRAESWGKDIMLIALTGWGQAEDRSRAQEAGFDHHMTKPTDPMAFAKVLVNSRARRSCDSGEFERARARFNGTHMPPVWLARPVCQDCRNSPRAYILAKKSPSAGHKQVAKSAMRLGLIGDRVVVS